MATARFPRRSNQSGEVLDGSTRITATSTTTSMTDWWCTARRAQCSSAANRSFATASCSLNAASVRSCTEVQVRSSANAADHRASSIPFDSRCAATSRRAGARTITGRHAFSCAVAVAVAALRDRGGSMRPPDVAHPRQGGVLLRWAVADNQARMILATGRYTFPHLAAILT
jgi:hypothetical protein